MFAVEAKGYSDKTISDAEMRNHKIQAQCGPISVAFFITSVSYNLYNDIKVKYYHPKNNNYKYDEMLSEKLLHQYYSGAVGYINILKNLCVKKDIRRNV